MEICFCEMKIQKLKNGYGNSKVHKPWKNYVASVPARESTFHFAYIKAIYTL